MRLGVDKRYGLVVIEGDSIRPIAEHVGISRSDADPLLTLMQRSDSLAAAEALDLGRIPAVPLDYAALKAPIQRPPKIIAAPVNYLDHKIEMNEQKTIAEYGMFLKAPTSIIGPDEAVQLPYTDKRIDQEGELAVVIGKRGKDIAVDDALEYVFGYTCLLDISVRSTEDRSTRKSFDTFTPIGPWVTTGDDVRDASDLALYCWVNEELRQQASTKDLIFDVPSLIAYASSVMTLEVGDVIATGTPAGVGSLSAGDTVRVHIQELGELRVTVRADHARAYAGRPQHDLAASR